MHSNHRPDCQCSRRDCAPLQCISFDPFRSSQNSTSKATSPFAHEPTVPERLRWSLIWGQGCREVRVCSKAKEELSRLICQTPNTWSASLKQRLSAYLCKHSCGPQKSACQSHWYWEGLHTVSCDIVYREANSAAVYEGPRCASESR